MKNQTNNGLNDLANITQIGNPASSQQFSQRACALVHRQHIIMSIYYIYLVIYLFSIIIIINHDYDYLLLLIYLCANDYTFVAFVRYLSRHAHKT